MPGSCAAKTPAVRCRGLHVRGSCEADGRAGPVAESAVDECSFGTSARSVHFRTQERVSMQPATAAGVRQKMVPRPGHSFVVATQLDHTEGLRMKAARPARVPGLPRGPGFEEAGRGSGAPVHTRPSGTVPSAVPFQVHRAPVLVVRSGAGSGVWGRDGGWGSAGPGGPRTRVSFIAPGPGCG